LENLNTTVQDINSWSNW